MHNAQPSFGPLNCQGVLFRSKLQVFTTQKESRKIYVIDWIEKVVSLLRILSHEDAVSSYDLVGSCSLDTYHW
jgi:hypothetical protein